MSFVTPLTKHLLISLIMIGSSLLAEDFPFDASDSSIEIFVPRAGFLSVLGHDHLIQATAFEGSLQWDMNDKEASGLKLVVPVGGLRVSDEEVTDETRSKIESEMKGEAVLDMNDHPEIRFIAGRIEPGKGNVWDIEGELSVAGSKKTIRFPADVEISPEGIVKAAGTVSLKPEWFGIKPVKALGGAIRTARTIEIRFDIKAEKNKKAADDV